MIKKKVLIEYLYLDLKTCDRCVGTDQVLEEVLEVLIPVLELAGYEVEYRKKEMVTAKEAKEYKFLSSPTIRVNGEDICDSVTENDCGCCGDISGTQVDCRVFEYEGKQYEVPPKAMLAEGILRTVFSAKGNCDCKEYELPENLKRFYEGKTNKSSCCCGGNCGVTSIKVLGAGCKSCHEQFENAKSAVKSMGLTVEVEYITDMEKVMAYGAMSMPAIVVNEKIVSMGKVLKAADVEKLLHKLGYQELL